MNKQKISEIIDQFEINQDKKKTENWFKTMKNLHYGEPELFNLMNNLRTSKRKAQAY